MKSCVTCPNFLTDDKDIKEKLARPVGKVAVCGKYGHLLGQKDQSPEDTVNLRTFMAEECDSYGEPRKLGRIANPQLRVAYPNPEIMEHPTDTTVASCHGCANLIRAEAVYDSLGYSLPLCRGKGTLIANPLRDAQGCSWGTPGTPGTNTNGITLRKELRRGFLGDPEKAFKALVSNGNLSLEPTTYPTDSDVSDQDRADGIKAWRKLEDPAGTDKHIFLPIFDSSETGIFSAKERRKIPQTGSAHHPELYIDYANLVWEFAVETWTLNQTLFIQSEPGLGKTEFVYYMAWLMQVPVTRLFFTDKIEWDDIYGKLTFRNGEMGWQDGRYTAAWRRAGLILVDEPNMAPSEIMSTLRTTTELDRVLYLDAGLGEEDEAGKEVDLDNLMVTPHPYCMQVWCGNPSWDPRNIGTKELAAADISRLSPAVLEHPPVAIERHIIKSTCLELDGWEIPEHLLDQIMTISTDIREKSKEGEFPGTWGIRENVKVARKLPWYPLEKAYRMAVLNHFEPDTRAMIVEHSIKTVVDPDAGKKVGLV